MTSCSAPPLNAQFRWTRVKADFESGSQIQVRLTYQITYRYFDTFHLPKHVGKISQQYTWGTLREFCWFLMHITQILLYKTKVGTGRHHCGGKNVPWTFVLIVALSLSSNYLITVPTDAHT